MIGRDQDEAARGKAAAPKHEIGQLLDALSVEELRERIAILRDEIARLEASAAAKEASRNAADAFFKR